MSFITVPYLALGESVKARLERLHYHGEDLESQCREVIEGYKGGAFQLYERLDDILSNFYDRDLNDYLEWQVWKHDLVTRWWLDMELESNTPVATHQLVLEHGINKRYLRGVGWIWFYWDDEETTHIPRRVVPQLDGLLIIDPRPSPWDVRQPLSIPQPADGHPHVATRAMQPPRLRRQLDIEWGHIDALSYPGLMEVIRPDYSDIYPQLELIHHYRYAIPAEWERLAYNWCSVFRTAWLTRLDQYAAPPFDYLAYPDLLWQHALVFACQTLGIDYVAWGLEAFPDAMFLSFLMASSISMSSPVLMELLDLSPQGRVVVLQRIIEECSQWTRPFMGKTIQLPRLAMFHRMQEETPREHTSNRGTNEATAIERAVDVALALFDNLLEPFVDDAKTTRGTDDMFDTTDSSPKENVA